MRIKYPRTPHLPWFNEAHRMLIIGDDGQELIRRGTFGRY